MRAAVGVSALSFVLCSAALLAQEIAISTQEKTGRVFDGVPAPKPTRRVLPEYPALARGAHVEGTVGIVVTVGQDGAVKQAVVRRHVGPLDDAALRAIRQWRFEPMLFNGKPVEFIFTQEMTFVEKDPAITLTHGAASIPLDADNDAVPPKIVKQVNPFYPSDPRQPAAPGRVILEVVVDRHGRVKSAIALTRPGAQLEQAAIAAVRQWEYLPAQVNGAAAEVVFSATVTFAR
jgi:TonB family protein